MEKDILTVRDENKEEVGIGEEMEMEDEDKTQYYGK